MRKETPATGFEVKENIRHVCAGPEPTFVWLTLSSEDVKEKAVKPSRASQR